MHTSARRSIEQFYETYQANFDSDPKPVMVEVGAGNDKTIHDIFQEKFEYTGMDETQSEGPNDIYKLKFDDESVDIVVSSSCFEHDEFFWVTFLECIRILKPHGLFLMQAPSNGAYHRYPVDCWRFYPDSANALARWARKNNYSRVVPLEQFTSLPSSDDHWRDYIAVWIKDSAYAHLYPARIMDIKKDYVNGSVHTNINGFQNPKINEDLDGLKAI